MKFVAIIAAAATAQAAVGTAKKGETCTGKGGCVADHFCGKQDLTGLTDAELKKVTGYAAAVGTETVLAKQIPLVTTAINKTQKCYAKATCGTTLTAPYKAKIDCTGDELFKAATALGATAIAALSIMFDL